MKTIWINRVIGSDYFAIFLDSNKANSNVEEDPVFRYSSAMNVSNDNYKKIETMIKHGNYNEISKIIKI
jgi:hypothetical protein